jgi:DNA-binding winged helix-turn-helix (wHTH) protein
MIYTSDYGVLDHKKLYRIEMTKYFIINDKVRFNPAENKLIPLGLRGREVLLHSPVSRFLFLLASRAGNIISQEEIYREVWEKHGQRVTPNTLYQNVSLLRRGLKTAGISTLTVKTHPKSGFSFFGQVQEFEESDEQESVKTTVTQNVAFAEVEAGKTDSLSNASLKAEEDAGQVKGKGAEHLLHFRPAFRIVLVFFAIIAFFMILTPSSTDEHFTQEQNLVARVNGCPVYVDRGNSKVGLNKILQYLREQEVSCREHDFLYMAKAPNVNQVIIMICNSADEDFKCRLLMKLPQYLTPESKPTS